MAKPSLSHPLVTSLGKKLGIDIHYFLPRLSLITGRYTINTIIALVVSIAFARLAEKETYGAYQYILSVVSLASIFSLPGLNTATLRAVVEGDEKAVAHSVRISFRYSLIATVILIILAAYRYTHGEPVVGIALGMAAFLVPFFYAPNNWYVYYEGNLDFYSSTIRIVVTNIAVLLGLLAGLKLELPLIGLVTIYFGINAILNNLFYFERRRHVKHSEHPSTLNIPYALRCTIQKFTTTLGENLQAIAVASLFGFANLAIYQVSQTFVNAFSGLTAALSSTYFPLLLKYKHLNHIRIVVLHILLGLGFWLIYLATIKLLFAPLYGVKYQDSINLAHIFSYLVIIQPLRLYFVNYFSAKDKNNIVIVSNVAASLIALGVFFASRETNFALAVTRYLYTLNGLMLIPLLAAYIFTVRSPRRVAP